MWLSAAIALASVWAGVVISYLRADLPPSFVIVSIVVGVYLATFGVGRSSRRSPTRPASSGVLTKGSS